jgi:hypothetical protein
MESPYSGDATKMKFLKKIYRYYYILMVRVLSPEYPGSEQDLVDTKKMILIK